MVASRRPSLIPKANTDPPSNPDTSSGNNKYWKGDKITNDPSKAGFEVDRGHFNEKGEFISHGTVQGQFDKLGPPPPLPPIPKEPPSNPNTASSVTGKKSMSQIKTNLLALL